MEGKCVTSIDFRQSNAVLSLLRYFGAPSIPILCYEMVMKSYMERRSSCRINVVPVLLQLARNRPAFSNISLNNLRRAANEELGVQQAIELVPDRLL